MENLDVTTVVFAIVAIFVIYKLRSVLGTRTGNERRPAEPPPAPDAPSADNVISLALAKRAPAQEAAAPSPDRWRPYAEAGTPLAQGFDAVAMGEPQFDATAFLAGARAAYEMIIAAFAAGDLPTLRRLLAPDVNSSFVGAIEARRAAGQTMATTLVSIDKAEYVEARVVGRNANVSVRFASKLISSTANAEGQVIEGSATDVGDHVDIWMFSRPLGARDPNWLLAATETVH